MVLFEIMTDANELRRILNKVKVNDEKEQKKKKTKPTLNRRMVVETTMKKYVNFGSHIEVHDSEPPIVEVNIKGFINDTRCINDVIGTVMDKICRKKGIREDTKLILDLRKLFFVSLETARSLGFQHLPWIHMRFSKVCVVLPPSEIVTKNISRAFEESFDYYHPLPLVKIVKDTKEIAHFIESTSLKKEKPSRRRARRRK